MKKLSKKFAVLNSEGGSDVIVLPINMAAFSYLVERSNRLTDGIAELNSIALNTFNTDYEGERWEALRRLSSNKRPHRWSSVVTAIAEEMDYDSGAYLKMLDGDVKITTRFFDYIQHKTNLKWIEDKGRVYVIADESIIPEGLTESYVNRNKLVKKDNIEDIYGDISTMRYHSQYHPEIDKQFTKFMDNSNGAVNFGFEAEKVDTDYVNAGIALKLAHETGFKKELDGSLGCDGFELISPVLPLFNQSVIDECIKPVKSLLNANTNNNCGGHINISKNGVHSFNLLKGIKGSLPLLYMMYERRLTNHYCEAKKFASYLRRPTKYSACYVKNAQILELRLFPAIKNTRVLQNRINMMRIIMQEMYGLSAMKVMVKLADPSSNLHKHVLDILDGNLDKLAEKIVLFAGYSEKYACGKISIPAKKKVNKLMNRDIFHIAEN